MSTSCLRHIAFHDKDDTAESRLRVTDFLVEATSCEQHHIWCDWCAESSEAKNPVFKNWGQLGGWNVTVGKIGLRPIAITLVWDRLDGFLVCFWEATSQLVDYLMIEKWLSRHFTNKTADGRDATCNAMNFHHCIHAYEDWKKPEATSGL